MMNKEIDLPKDEEARLHAAVSRLESEVQLFKTWLTSEQRQHPHGPNAFGATTARAGQIRDSPSHDRASYTQESRSIELLTRTVSQLKWGGLIAVVLILFAAFAVVVAGYRNTQSILQQIALHDLQITEPADGASVSDSQPIRGNTPYSGLNHYVVLTDAKTGHVRIQPARVSSAGSFSSEMTLNREITNAADKQPAEILLRVLATQEQLVTGPLITYPDDAKLSSLIRLLLKPVDRIVISSPAEGATIGLFEQVTGTSRVADMKHYILVTPVRTGVAYIQEQPVTDNNGNVIARAQFGTAAYGIGQQFSIEILATDVTLRPGPLTSKPADAVTSKPVTVTRR